jgi:hypothetical protein
MTQRPGLPKQQFLAMQGRTLHADFGVPSEQRFSDSEVKARLVAAERIKLQREGFLECNITISMLSGANFTKTIPGHVFSLTNVDVYEYDMKNLLVSYAAVLLVTFIAMCVGIYSLLENGVYHDTTFSTFMATMRNVDLDTMSDGTCLGDVKKIEQRKLMFGMLINDRGTESEESMPVNGETGSDYPHAAFGLEGTVVRLRKGALCS